MSIIKVNGNTIRAENVGMLKRPARSFLADALEETGLYVCFIGGGREWIADPDALEVETKFAQYDGAQEKELPF